jgi:CTD small phosphatase-like protein 2
MRRRCANISTAFFSFFCFFFPVHLSVLEPLSETLVNREGFFRAASLATNIATIAMQIRLTRNTHIIYVYFSLSLCIENRPNRADASIQRRLSSSGILNSAISMLKSIAKSASSKRERAETTSGSEEDVDDFLQGEDALNAKRAKRSLGTNTQSAHGTSANNTTPPPTKKADPDSSFITSSVRKSKKSKSEKEDTGGGRQLRFTAATNNASKQSMSDDDVEIGGSAREEGEDDVEAARTRTTRRKTNINTATTAEQGVGMIKRGRKRFMDSIFSPMFSFLSGTEAAGKKGVAPKAVSEEEEDGAAKSTNTRTASRLGSKKYARLRATTPPKHDKGLDDVHEDEDVVDDDDDDAPSTSGAGRKRSRAELNAILSGFTVDTDDDEAEFLDSDDEYDEEFDPWAFIFNLPPLEQCVPKRRKTVLPTKKKGEPKNTLVLDLDETLVHSNLEEEEGTPDFTFPVQFNNETHAVNVRIRPHLEEFMKRVSRKFEVVIFTASQKVYADKLLDHLDPDRVYFSHRIFRDSCVLVEGNYLKDLSVLGRDLSRTLIIDNSPQAFGFQVENGVPIESWYDDPTDDHLLRLLPVLDVLSEVNDVKPILNRTFELKKRTLRAGARAKRWRELREKSLYR